MSAAAQTHEARDGAGRAEGRAETTPPKEWACFTLDTPALAGGAGATTTPAGFVGTAAAVSRAGTVTAGLPRREDLESHRANSLARAIFQTPKTLTKSLRASSVAMSTFTGPPGTATSKLTGLPPAECAAS